MADYEIVAVRQAGDIRTHHIDAVQVGTSLFLVDQIIGWIGDGTYRFWVYFGNEEVDVSVKQNEASGQLPHGRKRRLSAGRSPLLPACLNRAASMPASGGHGG